MADGNGKAATANAGLTPEDLLRRDERFERLVGNAISSREEMFSRLFGRHGSDCAALYDDCGYPNIDALLEAQVFRSMYDREAIPARVVDIMPDECWQVQPSVYEDEDEDQETEFERAFRELDNSLRGDSWFQDDEGSPIWEHLKRIDKLSSIGRFGCLLLGINDGRLLGYPVEGFEDGRAQDVTGISEGQLRDQTGFAATAGQGGGGPALPRSDSTGYSLDVQQYPKGSPESGVVAPWQVGVGGTELQYQGTQFAPALTPRQTEERKLLFMRCFDESLVQIVQYEADLFNPRYGLPVRYRITLNDPRYPHTGIGLPLATVYVHWSRVVHVPAERLVTSEIFGVPEMQQVYNHLLDLRKLYGGSAEMYWRGAFPGLSFETHPQLGGDVNLDVAGAREQSEMYFRKLDRALVLMGMTAKSLAPQVVDPTPQITTHLQAICVRKGVPMEIFVGSEKGAFADEQGNDDRWEKRLRERRRNRITPQIIVPTIDRLVKMGILPEPKGAKGKRVTQNAAQVATMHAAMVHNVMAYKSTGKEEYKQTAMAYHEALERVASGGVAALPVRNEATQFATDKKTVRKKSPKAGYSVDWDDDGELTEQEQAQVLLQRTQAYAAYVSGNVESIMEPLDYLAKEAGYDREEAEQIVDDVIGHLEDSYPDTPDESVQPGHLPSERVPEPDPQNPMLMNPGQHMVNPQDGSVMAKVPVLKAAKPAPFGK